MDKQLIFFYLLAVIGFIGCNESRSPALTGSYHLLQIQKENKHGQWLPADWMKNGTGFLSYSPDGYVSVHFLPEFYQSDPQRHEAYWYVAQYDFNPDSGVVYHTRLMHSDPKQVGKTVRRRIQLSQDTLTMYADEYKFRLRWLKMRDL